MGVGGGRFQNILSTVMYIYVKSFGKTRKIDFCAYLAPVSDEMAAALRNCSIVNQLIKEPNSDHHMGESNLNAPCQVECSKQSDTIMPRTLFNP